MLFSPLILFGRFPATEWPMFASVTAIRRVEALLQLGSSPPFLRGAIISFSGHVEPWTLPFGKLVLT